MSTILKQDQQRQVSPQRGLPVNDIGASSTIQTSGAETVQLYYYSSGVQTTDAGQPAGTLVVGALTRGDIKNQLGTLGATNKDTSLSFTSTALTSEVAYPVDAAEGNDSSSAYQRLVAIAEAANLQNGQYCVDYVSGIIYGKKASTQTSLTNATYKYRSQVTGGGGPTSDVNVNQWGGVTTTLGQQVMASSVPVVIASNQSSIPTIPGTFSTITTSSKTVASAGTAEPLVGVATPISLVEITGLPTNTGNAYIGDSTVNSTTNPGIVISPGQVYGIAIADLANIYCDVDVNGEGVSFNYFN